MLKKKNPAAGAGAGFMRPGSAGSTAKPAKGRSKGKGSNPIEDFKRERLVGMNSVPNQQVVDEAKAIRKTHVLRGYTWSAVVLTPPLLVVTSLGGLLVWSGVLDQTAEITRLQAMVEQPASQSRAEAEVSLADWLAAPGQTLPDPQLLYWESSETMPGPELTEEELAVAGPEVTAVYEIHRFKVFSGGVIFTAAVQTSTTGGVTVVASTPSLSSDVPGDQAAIEVASWPGAVAAPVTEDLTRAAQKWAAAYVSGESAELTAVTGDTSGDHQYMPIAGAQIGEVTVESAAAHPENETAAGEPVDVAMVRVSFPMSFDPEATDEEVAKAPKVSFDLLVRQAATSAPLVTSWGVPGAGPTLSDYSAALPAAAATSDEAPEAVEAPAPTATPEATAAATAAGPDQSDDEQNTEAGE